MSILLLNGKTSNTKPDNLLVINNVTRYTPDIINGYEPTDDEINGNDVPAVLSGCELNLPLYHPIMSQQIKSLDKNPCILTNVGASWMRNGYRFYGDDYMSVATNATLKSLNSLSVFGWVNINAAGTTEYIISHYDTGANKRKWSISHETPSGSRKYMLVNLNLDGLTPGAANSKKYLGSQLCFNGVPHFIGFTFDAPTSVLTLYVDGIPDLAPTTKYFDAAITSLYATDLDIQIFRSLNSGASDGICTGLGSEFEIYNRALTRGEISKMYNSLKWRFAN